MCLTKTSQKAKTMNLLVRFVSEMQPAVFEPGDLCYFWRDGEGWSPGMATVVSQVGQGHHYVDNGGRSFKQSAAQLSRVTERERLAQEAVRESQDPGRDVDHVNDEPELPQQPSQTSRQGNNVAPVCLSARCFDA